MANLTIAVDEDSLKKARIRALREGTSVNAILRDFLESYAGSQRERRDAVNKILSISGASKARRGGAHWSREELHERS
jgi:plasmid stability protein